MDRFAVAAPLLLLVEGPWCHSRMCEPTFVPRCVVEMTTVWIRYLQRTTTLTFPSSTTVVVVSSLLLLVEADATAVLLEVAGAVVFLSPRFMMYRVARSEGAARSGSGMSRVRVRERASEQHDWQCDVGRRWVIVGAREQRNKSAGTAKARETLESITQAINRSRYLVLLWSTGWRPLHGSESRRVFW